jgi:ubiquinone/menaquinone biosynthesis C-methylase UbiE
LKPREDHFSAVADAYATRRPGYPQELFAYLAELCEHHELAWDCAAGTGQATIPLTRFYRRVVATDASRDMLEMAPQHPSVEYRVAPADASGLPPGSVDLVTVAQALHWLDLETFYVEVDRVLAPGGLLAVWTYGNLRLEDAGVNHLLDRFYREIVGPYWPAERRHVESGYRTLPFPYKEVEPPAFSMKQHWSMDQVLGYVGTWSATHAFRKARREDPVQELAKELIPRWGDSLLTLPVSWPLSLRVGRKFR